ncbi:MAG: TIGR03960 family B12-binding radical SAM protein, partial [Anaerolineaceae bacterium]|nr:TIGR03960 family B12-binding radical SAM protein [Anaerolineaceae bacterium]
MTPDEIKNRLERILLKVQRPGRYVGGEYNQVVKMWEQVQTRVALIFPDIYDLGIANLGLAILYEEINRRSDALAERVYSPWTDMEQELRQAGIPLFSLESKRALTDFDILAITLPYETLYTNVLNLLDLAGIPLYASDRSQRHPLVIAGGQAAFNPEPMTDFIDAFVIGEGEEVIHEVLDVQLRWKRSGDPRAKLLANLSQIPGVYVPSLYQPHYHADGTLAGFDKLVDRAPLPIVKRIVPTLPPPPERFIVPSINVVHNRVAIEIMRGCTRGCRFCHAGMVNRPVRERPVDQIVEAIEKALESTGYEEVALLSLSSSDYTHILQLVEAISQKFQGKNLTISLPSLRIESFSIDLLEQLKGVRQGGFTLAPEAATDRMRSIINKPIPSQQLLEITRQIYSRSWKTIKLYFLIGHPSETLEDVQAIAELCQAVIAEGRKVIGKRASLHIGVSTFVPKPHTPFQWVACDTVEQITAKHNLLKKS